MALGGFGSSGNWLTTLNQGLGTLGQITNVANLFRRPPQGSQGFGFNQVGLNLGGLQIPSSVLGAGLTLAAPFAEREPGYAVEARQALRGSLTPAQQVGQFGDYLGQLGQNNPYQNLLNQIRQRDIRDIQQRFTAAFPSTVGAQGPEFGTLADYITQQALPREQAFAGDLAQSFMNRQMQVGQQLLNYAKPSGVSEALGQLGGLLMLKDLYGGKGNTGGMGGVGGYGTDGASQTQGPGGGLGFRTANGQIAPIGIEEAQQLAAQGYGNQIVTGSPASAGFPGLQGLLRGQGFLGSPSVGSAQGLASGLGAVGAGYALGQFVGPRLPNQATGALGGASAGAAAGFATGGPIDALIGAIAGGLGGAFGKSRAVQAQKSASIASETAAIDQVRPQALATFQQAVDQGFQTLQRLDRLNAQLGGGTTDASGILWTPLDERLNQLIQTDPEARQLYQSAFGRFLDPAIPQNREHWLDGMRTYISSRTGTLSDPKSLIVQQLHGSTEAGNFFPAVQQGQQKMAEQQEALQMVQRMLSKLGVG